MAKILNLIPKIQEALCVDALELILMSGHGFYVRPELEGKGDRKSSRCQGLKGIRAAESHP